MPYAIVDAFTDRAFSGNPAAVLMLPAPADEAWMQAVAREMNLSETAFLHPGTEAGSWRLRWLTPTTEVDLCGHATLAAAHVLWETRTVAADVEVRFETRSGVLSAKRDGAYVTLDFPAEPATVAEPPSDLQAALGAVPQWVGRNRMDLLVQLATAEDVRVCRPDLAAVARWRTRGVMITAAADEPGCDFVSRFFGPAAGVPEDPVTGSAHCALGPYWGERLGKTDLIGHQVSARGGFVRVGLRGNRVALGGQAITVARGELL